MRSRRRLTIFAVCLATLLLALAAAPWAGVAKALDENDYDDGIDNTIACDDFRLGFETFLGDVSIQDRSDEGWVWVAGGAERFQEVSGVGDLVEVLEAHAVSAELSDHAVDDRARQRGPD